MDASAVLPTTQIDASSVPAGGHSLLKSSLIIGGLGAAAGAGLAALGINGLENWSLGDEAQRVADFLSTTLADKTSPLVTDPALRQELMGIIVPGTEGGPAAGSGMRQFTVPTPSNIQDGLGGALDSSRPRLLNIDMLGGMEEGAASEIAARRNGAVSIPANMTLNVVQGAEMSEALKRALGDRAADLLALTQADNSLSPLKMAAMGGVAAAGGTAVVGGLASVGNVPTSLPVHGAATERVVQARQQPAHPQQGHSVS